MILKFLTMEAGSFTLSKVVFLDRDGVINEKAAPHDYIKNWKEFTFLPETIRAIYLLNNHGFCGSSGDQSERNCTWSDDHG